MVYTAEHPEPPETSEQLRARIPGWGADLDPKDRPGTPRERFDPGATGAHWDFPDRMPETDERERSIEHKFLTPVYGTAQPLQGLSGRIRRFAYDRYSEGSVGHWLLLIAGDRVESTGAHLRSLASLRPDNPITETGVLGEVKHHPISSRFGQRRADLRHSWIDPVVVAGPWLLVAGVALSLLPAARRR
jgi:hypothetical protein